MPVDPQTLNAVFKAYDVRGLVDVQLDTDLARAIGAAAAVVLADEGNRMVVGHDMRPSAEVLVPAFIEGVTSQGVDVTVMGLTSTDGLYYASGTLEAAGAMWTASHNPAEYNGVKLCRAGAAPVSIDGGLGQIRDLVAEGVPAFEGPTGEIEEADLLSGFAEHVRSFIDVGLLTHLEIAIDAGNGMAGHVVPAVFDPLPIVVDPMFFELDGNFPNHPADPIQPENLRDLQARVVDRAYPLGLAFDGDADRMFAVDERGTPVASSLIGALVADRILAKNPGATVLHNLICSRVVPETVASAGGTAIRTRVGHSFIKERMAETGALFAAEHSGHYYFRDNFRADSGLIAAMFLLEAVCEEGRPLSEVVAPYDRYPTSGEINFRVADQAAATDAVAADFAGADRDDLDGMTITVADGWFNLRPSNTEPLLRLNVEGDDQQAMERIRDRVAATVQMVNERSS